MTPPLRGRAVLGVDIGTSGSKGILVDPDGRVLATAERAHRPAYPRPGHVEWNGRGRISVRSCPSDHTCLPLHGLF